MLPSLSLSLSLSLLSPSLSCTHITSSQDYWTATVSADMCYNPDSIGCSIFVSFCGALPLTIGKGCYGAAICQVGTEADNQVYAYSMGLYRTAKYAYSKLNFTSTPPPQNLLSEFADQVFHLN